MAEIEFETGADGIGTLTMNRPEKRNAVSGKMRRDLLAIVTGEEFAGCVAVVLRAQGQAFCAGVDLAEIGKDVRDGRRESAADIFFAFRRSGPVIIAAVQGYALGLGSGIAMAADLVIAADDAQFGYPEVVHGLVAGITMVPLVELVGIRKAMELLVTGRRIPAAEALSLGMVNEVVPAAAVRDRAHELATKIASYSRPAVRSAKRFLYEAVEMPFSVALRGGERAVELLRHSKGSQDGVAAFLQGRTATWEAR